MTDLEYMNYLKRIDDIKKTTNADPVSILKLQLCVSILKWIEGYEEMGVKMDRDWLESQISEEKNNSQG